VDADVEQGSAPGEFGIGEPRARSGDAAPADVVRLDVGQVAEPTPGALFVEHRHRSGVAIVKADHTDSLGRGGRLGDPLRALEGVRERFLDEDVVTRLERRDGDRLVEPVGRRHDDGVDGVVDDQFVVGLVGPRAELLGEPVALLGNQVDAGDDVRAEFPDATGVEVPHAAEPDDSDTDAVADHVRPPDCVPSNATVRRETIRFDVVRARFRSMEKRGRRSK
jgi:hypothetical protein